MKYLSILTLALLSLVVPAKADTLTVSSTFTFGPAGSDLNLSESGNFSFNWDTATNLIQPDTIAWNFTGTYSPFSLLDYGTMTPLSIFHASPFPFIGWRNSSGDTLELALQDLVGNGFPKTTGYDVGYGGVIELWTAHTEQWPVAGTLNVNQVSVPEPGLISMLLAGIASIFILYVIKGSQCQH